MTPISLRLRELREAAELTQQGLADRAGVRQATISELENPDTDAGRVKLSTLERLADALGVEPSAPFLVEARRSQQVSAT